MQHPDEGTIHAWLEGALPPAEASAFEAHVAACSGCRDAVAEARGLIAASSRILSALDSVPAGVIPGAAPASPAAAAEAAARRAAETSAAARSPRRFRSRLSPQARAAAAVVILAAGAVVVSSRASRRQTPPAGADRAPTTETRAALQSQDSAGPQRASTTPSTTAAAGAARESRRADAQLASAAAAANSLRRETKVREETLQKASAQEAIEDRSAAASDSPIAAPSMPLPSAMAAAPATVAPVAAPGEITLRGRVTDERGVPVPAASVVLDSTRRGTLTGSDGAYELTVPRTADAPSVARLTVRRIGFRSTTERVALDRDTVTFDVAMQSAPVALSEVVVTGTGVAGTRDEGRAAPAAPAAPRARDKSATPGRATLGSISGPSSLYLHLVDSNTVATEDGQVVRRRVYEVRPGVEVTLEMAAFIAEHQLPRDARRSAPQLHAPRESSMDSLRAGMNSIFWRIDDGTEYMLTGPLPTDDLLRLKPLIR